MRKPRTTTLLLVVLAVALGGLIILQAYLINVAFTLKEQAFRENVNTALATAALKLKAGETLSRIRGGEVAAGDAASGAADTASRPPVLIRREGEYTILMDTAHAKRIGYSYRLRTDSNSMTVHVNGVPKGTVVTSGVSDRDRFFVVSTVYDNLFADSSRAAENITPALLDSVLKGCMRDAGVPLPFAYGLVAAGGDSVRLASPREAAADIRASDFRSPLFRMPFGPPRDDIAVAFSGRSAYILAQLWPVLAASVLFIAVLVWGFASAVRTILRQERLAASMVDFINNMTHEFKTPIATVTLASEAIGRPDIIRNTAKVKKYNGMIAEESLRMKKQVDRILEMAVIEEGDYELSLADVDMHDVIRRAVGNAALGAESRGGTISCTLSAEAHTIRGDAVHLENIVHNLLDNAVKYSPGAPAVSVTTAVEDGFLVVGVRDRGIGIPPEHLGRVFDKYYRVPTGNLHDVKGFGLGLRYVRLLTEAHGGTVALRSSVGEGTEVTLKFPLKAKP
ncbi:MAG TPA: HAMP domain-containing sensor histidine kinase [Bacteroidota bacterium]|nr:HAMP domain-containing sensor histidine kinase [Bacteroidota bacterium]